MGKSERAQQLRWLMILRVVTITTLLVSAFAIELLVFPSDQLRPLFLLAAAAYGTVLLYAILDRWLAGHRAFIYLQLVGDAAVLTAFVGITGGISSAMSFLYLLPIAVASLMLLRRGGMILALVCWSFYTALIVVGPIWPGLGEPLGAWLQRDPGRATYALLIHPLGMFAVAWFAGYFSERLKVQDDELQERRGAVARLKALNENIIESINSGLVTTDLDGRINFINRGGAEIVGREPAHALSQEIEPFFGFEPGTLAKIRDRLLAHRRFRFERDFRDDRGRRIYLGIAASNLYDRTGHPIGIIFIFQDLTEIQALEEEVRFHERMAALGEMAAGMAHELRNPLASISGSVQYLRENLGAEGESAELMDIILRESHRLDRAIRDFLTFAKPGPFQALPTDLSRLLRESGKLLEKSSEFHIGHRLEIDVGAEPVEADVDPDRLRQIFWNLATNALKAMPEGGRLRLGLRRLPGRPETIEIVFDDEGKGMDASERERYFQPFQGSFEKGSGLGAAIVYRLIEEHGGRVTVESSPGQGTRVRLAIPRWRRSGRPHHPVAADAAASEARRS